MSSFKRGKDFETKVAKMIRRIADSGSMRNAGSYANWHRRSDVFTNLPMHVECKDHKTVKIKDWFDQAKSAANGLQIPVVVFAKDEEVLACLKFEDLLNLYKEIADLQSDKEQLRTIEPVVVKHNLSKKQIDKLKNTSGGSTAIARAVESKVEAGAKTCPQGHIADEYGFCMQKKCKYNRGYKAPKTKKGRLG